MVLLIVIGALLASAGATRLVLGVARDEAASGVHGLAAAVLVAGVILGAVSGSIVGAKISCRNLGRTIGEPWKYGVSTGCWIDYQGHWLPKKQINEINIDVQSDGKSIVIAPSGAGH